MSTSACCQWSSTPCTATASASAGVGACAAARGSRPAPGASRRRSAAPPAPGSASRSRGGSECSGSCGSGRRRRCCMPVRSGPKTKATRCGAAASVANSARAARRWAGRSRAASSPWRRRAARRPAPRPACPRRAPAPARRWRRWPSPASRRGSARRRSAARTSTRSVKPITFIARAVAPTLPAWLVCTRMKRVGSVIAAKIAHSAVADCRRDALSPCPPHHPPPAQGLSHVASAPPHAQHRHQGGTRSGVHHQPRRAGPGGAEGRQQGPERLRLRSRPDGRADHHRDAARGLPGPRHPGRRVGPHARCEGQRVRLDHRPARRHHQLHPRLPGLCGQHRAGAPQPGAAGGGLRPDAQRHVLRLARAAARS